MSSNKRLRVNFVMDADAHAYLKARAEAQGTNRGMGNYLSRLVMEDWARQEMRQENLETLRRKKMRKESVAG